MDNNKNSGKYIVLLSMRLELLKILKQPDRKFMETSGLEILLSDWIAELESEK